MSKNFDNRKRIKNAFIFFLLIIGILIFRIGYLSIYKCDTYKEKIEKQSTQKINLSSGRGIIYDRNNIPLTDTNVKKAILVPKHILGDNYRNIDIIKINTGLSENAIFKAVQEQLNLDFIEIEVDKLSKANTANLKELGVLVVDKKYRYEDNNLLIHTIGYVNKSDNRGVSGIEKSMNSELEYANENYISVFKAGNIDSNNKTNLIKGSIKQISENEKNLRLTIDYNIQKKIEDIVDMEENPTAVVVSDVKTGEILAMSSRPSFNPNNIESFLNKSGGELRNRVVSATYPAGSVFKIVVLFAALESKVINNSSYYYNCTGSEEINSNERLNCNNIFGHRVQTLGQCFANSCNTAFYDIAKKTGKEEIFKAIKKLHLDEKVDISLDEEVSSKLPQNISLSNLSIGQGALEFTPLQINQLTQIIANNGFYKHLHIYDSVVDKDFNIIKKLAHSKEDEIISPYTTTQIKQFMVGVAKSGTAKELNELTKGCGVKTGTAQSSIEGINISHGWITGFYPLDDPKYAITVLVEGTKENSKSAIPIFKEICKAID